MTTAALLVLAVSCKDSFLDVNPTAAILPSQLNSKAGIEGQLIGVYSMLSGRGTDFYSGATNWFWGSVLGAEANKGTNSGDQAQMNEVQAYNTLPSNTSNRNKYRGMYEGIARANYLLGLLADPGVAVSAADNTRITAETRFLRGFYYMELKRLYDDTPYVDETATVITISAISNNQDLWPFIEADFQAAVAGLPATQAQAGRVNSHAANAFLAKAYLYQNKYDQALTILNTLIASGVTANNKPYNLVPTYGSLFRVANDNNEESVFAIQSAAGTGTVNNANPDFVLNYPYNGGPAGCCGFFQPSFDQVNAHRTTAGGLPLTGNAHRLVANELVTDQGVPAASAFTPDAGPIDPRLDHSVGRRGIPFMDHGPHPGITWIRDQNYGGPYAPKKYLWSKAEETANQVDKSSWTPGYTAHNIYLMRFADILLMAAECEIEKSSPNLANALTHINRVRTRAANPAGFVLDAAGTAPAANYVISNYAGFATQAEAREALRMERRLELGGEGHRFYDLVRWGVAATELNAYLAYERTKVGASPFTGAAFTPNKSEYQPIPQTEIDILGSSVLIQNPGY